MYNLNVQSRKQSFFFFHIPIKVYIFSCLTKTKHIKSCEEKFLLIFLSYMWTHLFTYLHVHKIQGVSIFCSYYFMQRIFYYFFFNLNFNSRQVHLLYKYISYRPLQLRQMLLQFFMYFFFSYSSFISHHNFQVDNFLYFYCVILCIVLFNMHI